MREAIVCTGVLIRYIDGKRVSEVFPKDGDRMELAIQRATKAGYKVIDCRQWTEIES